MTGFDAMRRKKVRRVLTLSENDRRKFDGGQFMGVPLGELSQDELRGLFVWAARNRMFIADFDAIITK